MSEQQAEYTRDKTIFRVAKNADNPFVMIDRRPIENPKLSWKAKGLLAYLISRPDDWVVRFRDLVNRSPDGGHTVRGAMKELKAAGHVQVIAERDGGRVKRWIYEVYELPPDVEFQQVEKQQVENRTLNKNKSLPKRKRTNIKEGASATPKATDFPEVVLFRSVAKRYPSRDMFEVVVSAIQKIKVRLGREVICDDLLPFWNEWRERDYKKTSLKWLTEWAVTGKINGNGSNKKRVDVDALIAQYEANDGY